ncbi:hypothetical protein PTTG_28404 [Puccinia triticina 1-1 BBBD Race 1]|uniref:CCHC-type domain-containing protein n=1 Tax=Puccinia triticina (isolate 1-1 / race 1 (BBBD)) TaxID=630390 RepID=A0A180GCB2_PUCT1|nr:hypothetical protein PTTG_28404 [Puccinia triticina 1-1 BBBD Race 1]
MDPAALQQQLADLMAVVNEERALRRQAEAEHQEAEEAQAQAPQVGAPAVQPAARGPKVAVPDKFDGVRGTKAEVFAGQVNLYMAANPTAFPDDRARIIFALSYLTGQASARAQPWMLRTCVPVPDPPVVYHNFATAFGAMYYDTEMKTKAERAPRLLKQTRSEEATLVSHYTQGLKRDIRLALVLAQTTFATLHEVSNLALKIDNEIGGAEGPAEVPPTTAPADPNAMDLSAMRGSLSSVERTTLMRKGQCFRCEKKGHIARDCPDKPEKGKDKLAIRISELEGQLQRLTLDQGTSGGDGRADQSKNGDAWV